MKFKGFIISALLLFISFSVAAQNRSKKFDFDAIKSDTTYFWGANEVVNDQDEAFELSVNELYNNIANKCKADAIYVGKGDQKTQLRQIIKTFENKIKEKMIQVPVVEDFDDEEYSYFVYLKKSDFRDICNERKKSINRLALRGYNSENEAILQYEDALKSYYWGMMLCLAHPQGNSLEITIEDEKMLAYEWFINRIDGGDGVLKSFSFIVPKENAIEESGDNNIIVNLNARSTSGVEVSNLQFKYYNGQNYIPTSVNNGKAVVVIPKTETSINIRIEYEFKIESTIDPEVNKVLNTIKHNIKFKNEKLTIDIGSHVKDIMKKDEIKPGGFSNVADDIKNKDIKEEWRKIDSKFNIKDPEYLSIMQDIEKALRNNNYESIRHHFTSEGYGILDTLSRYGKMTVVGTQDYSFMKFGNQVLCRDINMLFNFRNHASFNNDVVFRFDHATKKVTSIAFRLSSTTENDIISKTNWPEEARLVLINFLEDYQTAYALKRHDYLESIYSEDALIIVGHVVKKTVIPDRAQFNISENEVKLMKYDKDTYFKNLTRTFKSQDYINIRFAETDFTRAKSSTNREVYGVRLLQEYNSSTYGDIGYLFILVDLTDNAPLIHVRAWQPDEVDLERLMGMKDLRF